MRLPAINTIPRNRLQVLEFRGLNKTQTCAENEFSSMRNMSSDKYPYIKTCFNRYKALTFNECYGVFVKDDVLYYVDGTQFKKHDSAQIQNDSVIGTVTKSEKTFISMGAYIVIFPDKKIYNTADGTFKSLESTWTQSGAVTFQNAYLTESQVSNDSANVYIKISATGIGSSFNLYDGVKISGITATGLTGLNKTAVIYEKAADWILIIGFDITGTITQSTGQITLERKVPDMDFVTESENRLWGCSSDNHEIYACKLGDPFNWNCFEGISTDSYAATVGTDGDFTGAITHLGYVLFFKEECLHKIYGSKPSQYTIITTTMRGVKKGCDKSLAIVNENLYYVSASGVCIYQGALPSDVGKPLGDEPLYDAVAGTIGNKYYLSCEDRKGYHMYVYDESVGTWVEEDAMHINSFIYSDHILGFRSANDIYAIISEEHEGMPDKELPKTTTWEAVTGPIKTVFKSNQNFMTGKKRITKLTMQIDLHEGSYVDISVSYDDGLYQPVKTFSSATNKTVSVMFIPHRCDHFKIKFHGGGYFALKSMTKYLENGSDD